MRVWPLLVGIVLCFPGNLVLAEIPFKTDPPLIIQAILYAAMVFVNAISWRLAAPFIKRLFPS